MKNFLFSLKHSLFSQISAILIIGTAAAFLGLFTFLQVTEDSTGKGSAINVSGSLRMQSYVLALTVARSVEQPEPERKNQILGAEKEFERRLLNPGLTNAIPKEADNRLRITYESIYHDFYQTIKPLAEKVILQPDQAQLFLNSVPSFVSKIDAFVLDLENDLERKTRALGFGLSVLMFCAIALCWLVRLYLRRILFDPLEDLARLASEVRSGDFSHHSTYSKKNEIGSLAGSMNFMIRDLSRLYSSLEEQVREKTADLNRQKESIELLYELKNILFNAELNRSRLEEALRIVVSKLKGEAAALSLCSNPEELPRIVAETENRLGFRFDKIIADFSARELSEYTIRPFSSDGIELILISVPANIGNTAVNLLLLFKKETKIKADRSFVRNICREFAQAADAAGRSVESKRLALFEERSTIARELHDSIAQSLAFSRIQLTRLSAELQNSSPNPEVSAILEELRLGVRTAYQQLRSVLTTFRLKPKSSDLRENILSALDEFKERSGIPYVLRNDMQSYELGANQQIHLLQILREALSNVEKHAHAKHVSVSILSAGNSTFTMHIQDDGIGISTRKKEGHYGLEIMAERARVLHGSLEVRPAAPCGTEVILHFSPSAQE